MTLTVCLQGNDGLVVAADSRGTFGDPRNLTAQNDNIKKVYLVGCAAISVAGNQNTNMILEEAKDIITNEKITNVTDIMLKVRDVSIKRYNEWYAGFPPMHMQQGISPNYIRPPVQLSVAGYNNSNGSKIARLYSMVSQYNFAPSLHDFGFVLLGVAQYALYLLNRLYSIDMNVNDLKHLAAYVISETATQDGKVGGPIQMAVIPRDDSSYMLNNDDLVNIMKENENRTKELKNLFKKG